MRGTRKSEVISVCLGKNSAPSSLFSIICNNHPKISTAIFTIRFFPFPFSTTDWCVQTFRTPFWVKFFPCQRARAHTYTKKRRKPEIELVFFLPINQCPIKSQSSLFLDSQSNRKSLSKSCIAKTENKLIFVNELLWKGIFMNNSLSMGCEMIRFLLYIRRRLKCKNLIFSKWY